MTKGEILAMEANEELDKLVAAEVMNELMSDLSIPEYALELQLAGSPIKSGGGNWLCLCQYEEGDIPRWHPLPFSTDILVAWQVVDKMFKLGYAMSLLHLSSEFFPEYWYCDFRPKDSNKPPKYEWVDHQMTAPVAISKAALLTRLEEIKKLEGVEIDD